MAESTAARVKLPKRAVRHAVIFVVVNAALLAYTAVTGGGFWWLWVTLGFWGFGLALDLGLSYWLARRGRWDQLGGQRRSRLVNPNNPLGDWPGFRRD